MKLIFHLFQIVTGSTALFDISDSCDMQSEDDSDSFDENECLQVSSANSSEESDSDEDIKNDEDIEVVLIEGIVDSLHTAQLTEVSASGADDKDLMLFCSLEDISRANTDENYQSVISSKTIAELESSFDAMLLNALPMTLADGSKTNTDTFMCSPAA